MRTPALFTIVVTLHILAVGAFVFIQGCGTRRPAGELPPAPIMPPKEAPLQDTYGMIEPPVFEPPVPVEAAAAVVDWKPGETYTIKKGDTLSEVAKRYGLKSRELAQMNNIDNPNKIRVGQKLVLPAHAAARPSTSPRAVSAPATSRAGGPGSTYVVVSGDNLTKIAKLHGTSVKALREANSLTSDRILVGQKLSIPGASPASVLAPKRRTIPAPAVASEPAMAAPVPMAAPQAAPKPVVAPERAFEYTVAEGDTLETIARDFVVLKDDIVKVNNLGGAEEIRPGQTLIIPMP